MRFPIHTPEPADDGRRPARSRLAAFGVAAVFTASAALAAPFTATADEAAADDTAANVVVEESAATAEPTAAPAEQPGQSAGAPAEEAAAAPVEEAAEAPAEEPPAAAPADAAPAEAAAEDQADLAEFAEEAAAEYDVEPAKGTAEASATLAPAPAGLGPNLPPVAVDDHYVVVQDTTLVVDDPGILLNDHDPENQWYTVDSVLPELPTEMTYSYDGSFTYTPPAGFVGTRVFTYELEDAESLLSAPATITIEVLPAGASAGVPPIANDDLYLWAWNTPLYIPAPGVLANDADADGDPSALTVSLVTGPYEGSVALNADGSFLFTQLIDESNGSYWFDYRACDATTCADGRVQLEEVESGGVPSGPSQPPAEGQPAVDLPPVAQPDALDAISGELAKFAAPGVLGNDSDPEGQPLVLVGVSQPAHGTIYYWNGDGAVQYEPNDGFAGTDQVTYTVSDGTQTATSTITFTVTEPANYAPQALEDEVTMLAGTTLAVGAPGVLGNDSDQDGDPLAVTWAGDAQHGTAAVAADGSFTYTPDAGFTGTDYVGYEVGDGTGTDSTTLIIHVLPADAPAQPSVVGDHYTAMSGALLDVPAPGVLGNDLAPSGPLSVVDVEPAQHGTVDVEADGSLRYTSDAGYTGVDTMRYTVSDGAAQADGLISITVLAAQEDCPADEGLAGTRLGALPAIAVPWEPVPGEPCEADSEPSEEPGEEHADSSSTPTEPADNGSAAPPADQPARTETASTDAPALASTGTELGLAAAVAALLLALGVMLRLRRRAAEH